MHALNTRKVARGTRRRTVWLLLAAAALLARPAAAQQTTFRGSLAPGDKTLANGVLSDEYQVQVRAGTRLEATLIKTDPLQAAVILLSPSRGVLTMEYEAKWTGERLVDLWTADVGQTETVTLIVAALAPPGRRGTSGDYTMLVNAPGAGSAPAPPPSPPRGGGSRPDPAAGRTLRAGESVRGQLTASAPTLDDQSHYADYSYTARAGERITVTLTSGDFDAMLFVAPADGGDPVSDDDSGGGTNSRVEYTASRAGPLLIRVNTLQPREVGAFTLTLASSGGGTRNDQRPPRPSPAPVAASDVLRAGQRMQGELRSGGPRLGDGSHYHDYTYTARRGERITVTLTSDAFDAFLHVGWPGAGSSLSEAVTDDDGAGGTNARVRFVAARDGALTIRVNTLTGGETGRYTVVVERAR